MSEAFMPLKKRFLLSSVYFSVYLVMGKGTEEKNFKEFFMFTHLVFFWLKEGTAAGVREGMIRDAEEQLKGIATVRCITAGKAAMTPREVVDNSYDVGLCVIFDNAAGHDVYQTHELHKKFMADYKAYWKQVKVYDFQ